MKENKAFTFSASEQVSCNLMVSSHERSGTHFLINSIAMNSPYTSKPHISFDPWASGNIANYCSFGSVRNFFDTLQRNNCNSVIKSHFHADFFFDGSGSSALGSTKVVHIIRDPMEVLASFRRFISQLNDQGHREGPLVHDHLAFMLAEPVWNMLRYQPRQYGSMVERWIHHSTVWLNVAAKHSNVRIIRYRDLNENFEVTISGVLDFLGHPPVKHLRRPDAKINTVYVPNNESLPPEEKRHFTLSLRDRLSPEARKRCDHLLAYLVADQANGSYDW